MAYMKKSSKKRGKKMYKKGSFLEPGKEVKFGGPKKMQSAGERTANSLSNARRREMQEETTRNSPNPPRSAGNSGTPVGTRAGNEAKYAAAKRKDPKLAEYIKKRKEYSKGSKEYNYYQNKINKAYGKGPTNRPEREPFAENRDPATGRPRGTGRPAQTPGSTSRGPNMTPVTAKKEAKPISNERPTPTIKKPATPKPTGTRPPTTSLKGDRKRERADKADQRMKDRRNRRAKRQADRAAKRKPNTTAASKVSADDMKKLEKDINRPMMYGGKKMGMGGYGKKMSYQPGGKKKNAKGSFPDLTGDGKVTRADVLKGRGVFQKGGKKGGGMSGLSAAQKEVYRRGLAAYMSSGNRPKTSQHAWAMARVKSDFGKREAAKIRSGKSGKGKKK